MYRLYTEAYGGIDSDIGDIRREQTAGRTNPDEVCNLHGGDHFVFRIHLE
jgi:hypothetical protein